MAKFRDHFSGTVRTTKDDLRYGPLKWRRVNAVPADTYGRNGDFIIVDDTAESDENIAVSRVPTDVSLCQKIPFVVSGGTFTITAPSGVYTITISSMDDFIEQVTRASIPELRVEYTDPKTIGGGNNYLLHANSVTFADGTSDLPSVLGIAGLQNGEVTVATGSWQCFPIGTGQIDVLFGGVPVTGTPFTDLNFTGAGVASVVDAGSGRVDITITGGGAGGPGYGVIVADTGTATATVASETITFGGIGIDVVAANAGAGLDTMSFNMDISDLPIGAGPLTPTDTIAVNDGGTTEQHTIEDVVETVLPGLTVTVINGQPMLTLEDTTRANKILSVAEQNLIYAKNQLSHLEWLSIGQANDGDSGFIADFDGTITYVSAHCENTGGGNSKDIRLFINAADNGVLGTLSGGANATFADETLNIDFSQGDRIRLRSDDGAGGAIQDTVVKLTIKWRG